MGDEEDSTLWVGNLEDRVTESLLFELFLQVGPLTSVKKPANKNFAFVEFKHSVSILVFHIVK